MSAYAVGGRCDTCRSAAASDAVFVAARLYHHGLPRGGLAGRTSALRPHRPASFASHVDSKGGLSGLDGGYGGGGGGGGHHHRSFRRPKPDPLYMALLRRGLATSPGPPERETKGANEQKELAGSVAVEKAVVDDGVDPRVWPIAVSTFVTGTAIGVALPVMPLFAREMGLTTFEFGLVGSVFGGTRLLSNVPLAVASETYGRRPFLTMGPMISAVSMLGTGLSTTLPVLLMWRVVTGIGGSAQMTGAALYCSDISKPHNRARTLAPMTAAFSAGAACGPAIGGALASQFGVGPCFYFTAGAIASVGVLNYFQLPETKAKAARSKEKNRTMKEILSRQVEKWRKLSSMPDVRAILGVHWALWFTTSGSQFTLMPIMASEHLHMSPGSVGALFAMVSLTNVVGSQISATVSDKLGRKRTIVPGLTLIATAVAGLPFATDGNQLTALMALWSVGGAVLSTGPTAYLSDLSSESERPQALAMIRSMGDLGLLMGAGCLGAVAHVSSMDIAFQANAAMLLAVTAAFAAVANEPRDLKRRSEEKAAIDAAERRRAVLTESRENSDVHLAQTSSTSGGDDSSRTAPGDATLASSELSLGAVVTSATMEDVFMRKTFVGDGTIDGAQQHQTEADAKRGS